MPNRRGLLTRLSHALGVSSPSAEMSRQEIITRFNLLYYHDLIMAGETAQLEEKGDTGHGVGA